MWSKYVGFICAVTICEFGVLPSLFSISARAAVEDASSMIQQSNGLFQAVCKNLNAPENIQMVTADQIRANQVCGVGNRADIVKACNNAYNNGTNAGVDTALQCARSAKSASIVVECNSAFNNGTSAGIDHSLECLQSANDSSTVTACNQSFNNGTADGIRKTLQCIKGQH